MTTAVIAAGLAAMLLAFANGANDNSKGVATLIGTSVMSPRGAVIYGTIVTFLGSATAIVLATTLLRTFGGKGIVPESVIGTNAFPISVGAAAALTVLLATRLGIPISTTHALVGALVGVGLASEIIWSGVATKFVYPLVAAPGLAVAVTIPVYLMLRFVRKKLGITSRTRVLPERRADAGLTPRPREAGFVAIPGQESRQPEFEGTIVGLDAQRMLDVSHVLTAGAVSFARGLNDTPKIAAILLAAGAVSAASGGVAISPAVASVAVGVGMATGGFLAARRVAITMGQRITDMNDGQGFAANLVTAVLVIFASRLGVPVSTTHVSCGSLFGIGFVNGTGRWRTIGTIVFAWVTTLPLAGALGWVAWMVLA